MNWSSQALLLLLGSAALAITAPVAGQTWSAEQQAVLRVVEQSWEEDLGEDPAWIDRLTHAELLSWGNTYPMPRDQEESKRWSEYGDENSDALLHTISPVGITVRGDAAVVHYYARIAAENRDGERETTTSRCTDTLTQDGTTWRYLGWFCLDEPSTDE